MRPIDDHVSRAVVVPDSYPCVWLGEVFLGVSYMALVTSSISLLRWYVRDRQPNAIVLCNGPLLVDSYVG